MKCEKCGKVFAQKGNLASKVDGTTVTVCPNCGNEKLRVVKKRKA